LHLTYLHVKTVLSASTSIIGLWLSPPLLSQHICVTFQHERLKRTSESTIVIAVNYTLRNQRSKRSRNIYPVKP
jgi:hypothetical protein